MKLSYLNKKLSITLSVLLLSSSLLANELNDVTIIEDESTNYQISEKIEVNRSNIKLEDSAKSVQVYNQNFIKDYQAQKINDIILMSSNTAYTGNNRQRANQYLFRGFNGVPILRDGLNLNSAITNAGMYNIQRVEVVKGADSLQFGNTSPGGLINLVKKKSKKEDYGEIELEISSHNSIYPKFDIGGILNKDGSLRYRTVASYKNAESSKDFNIKTKQIFLAPSLAYDINENHTITFLAEYLDQTSPVDWGSYLDSKGELVAPRDAVVSSHPDAKFEQNQKIIGFDIDSEFNIWSTNFKYRYVDSSRNNDSVYAPRGYYENNYYHPVNGALIVPAGNVLKNFSTQEAQAKEHVTQFTINNEFEIAKMKNNITLGVDTSKIDSSLSGYYDTSVSYLTDVNNISYNSISSLSDHPNAYKYIDTKTQIKKVGIYIQDSLEINDSVVLSAGARNQRSNIHDIRNATTYTAYQNKKYNYNATTPQIGLVYKITPQTSLYTNYSESFSAPVSFKGVYIDANGKIIDAEKGKGLELGLKQKLFNNTFDLTSAIFSIEKENVAVAQKAKVNGVTVYKAAKLQRSKGLEFDINGNITKNLSIIASYGYTKTQDTQNNNKEIVGVPKHTANIFTTYKITPSIYIGGGARFIGQRYVDTANTIKLASNIIYNATIGYKKNQWKASISVKNLNNEEYVETASTSEVTVGEERTVIATLNYTF